MKRGQEASEEEMGNSLKEYDRFIHKPLAELWSPEGGKGGVKEPCQSMNTSAPSAERSLKSVSP